jgi:hypothetical protein
VHGDHHQIFGFFAPMETPIGVPHRHPDLRLIAAVVFITIGASSRIEGVRIKAAAIRRVSCVLFPNFALSRLFFDGQ